jgi:hypothetical protein
MKKMICISEFEDNLIHHLPDRYINYRGNHNPNELMRGDDDKMQKGIKILLEK